MVSLNYALLALVFVGPIVLVRLHQSGWLTDHWIMHRRGSDRKNRL